MYAYGKPRYGSYNSSRGNGRNYSPHLQHQQQEQQQRPTKYCGTTFAIGGKKPPSHDLKKTKELLITLDSFKVFESPDEVNHRREILAKLNKLFKQWIKNVSKANNMSEAAAEKLGGNIHIFGSYRLGVHHKGAGIEALCVAPRNIARSEFFTSFFESLKKQWEVTECRAVQNAFAPLIQIKFDGVQIDLLFARLSPKEIPDNFNLRDDTILENLDPQSVLSLSGCRVTDEIMELVPNIVNFRLALRSIKLWAKKHAIYSKSLGYFGDVTWAILVARTCQLYPNATASTLVQKFFTVFSRWRWPDPVLLNRPGIVNLQFPACGAHPMPVITPAYPQHNSAFNVSESTMKVILNELKRGVATTNEIMCGKASWHLLFEAPSFFHMYHQFIVVLVTSQTSDDQLEWCDLVESKIRLLVDDLERHQHMSLTHANPTCFVYKKGAASTQSHSDNENESSGHPPVCTAPFCSMWFIGLEFANRENLKVDLTENIRCFTELVIQHAVNIKMLRDGMNIEVKHVKRKSLSQYLDAEILQRESKCTSKKSILTKRNRRPNELLTEKEVATKKRRLS